MYIEGIRCASNILPSNILRKYNVKYKISFLFHAYKNKVMKVLDKPLGAGLTLFIVIILLKNCVFIYLPL